MKTELLNFLLVFLILTSCTTKDEKTETSSLIQTSVLKTETLPYKLEINKNDSLSYIGFVESFYPNNELYVEMYFKKDNIDFDEYDKISKRGDSIIYADDENRRTRIPSEIANKYFDLSGLEPLLIFDKNNKLIAKAHVNRIEYLDQNISPYFIGVFTTENPIKGKAEYCIGNFNTNLPDMIYDNINDSLLTKLIADKFKITHVQARHYKTHNSDNVLSVINSENNSHVFEVIDSEIKLLYKSHENEHIQKIIFVPKTINNKPVLLTQCYMPDSDQEWDNVLVFDGSKYLVANRQRIK